MDRLEQNTKKWADHVMSHKRTVNVLEHIWEVTKCGGRPILEKIIVTRNHLNTLDAVGRGMVKAHELRRRPLSQHTREAIYELGKMQNSIGELYKHVSSDTSPDDVSEAEKVATVEAFRDFKL